MEHVLADLGLRVICLSDASRIDAFDQDCLFADLWDGDVANMLLPWHGRFHPDDQDVLVLVSGSKDNQCLGVLAASQRATEREPFLLLEAAYVTPAARGRKLLQRMAAYALLSIARLDAVPQVIAACVRDAESRESMRDLHGRFSGASVFPRWDAPAIDLGMAAQARRIARAVRPGARYEAGNGLVRTAWEEHELVVLDLSASDEATIIQEARRLNGRRASTPLPLRRRGRRGTPGDGRNAQTVRA